MKITTNERSQSPLCTEQDTSQALQALASMPKDTLLQKLRAQGEYPCCSLASALSPAYVKL